MERKKVKDKSSSQRAIPPPPPKSYIKDSYSTNLSVLLMLMFIVYSGDANLNISDSILDILGLCQEFLRVFCFSTVFIARVMSSFICDTMEKQMFLSFKNSIIPLRFVTQAFRIWYTTLSSSYCFKDYQTKVLPTSDCIV